MKRHLHSRFSMRVYFTMLVIAEIVGIVVISYLFLWILHEYTDILEYIDILNEIPDVIWLLFFSISLGSTISSIMGKRFFGPITKLREAMRKVADGDFSVRQDDSKGFKEIRQMNSDFNLMVKELGSTEILQTDFVSNVSHEFKTPISAIEGYAMLLQSGDDSLSQEQEVYVKEILENTHRLSSLIGNMLLLSKVDNQNIQTQKEVYQLDEQIREAILYHEHKWMLNDIEFEADMESIEYNGNKKLLFHVWSNLIENAIKFGPKNSLIRISLKREAKDIYFVIEDEGPGITESGKKHLFDRFYQDDSSHKEEGNGLGLALVKQIVLLEKGHVWVENRDSGGARFIVVLSK